MFTISLKIFCQKIAGSPVRPEDLKQSQYFDALETIREEIDEVDDLHLEESGLSTERLKI